MTKEKQTALGDELFGTPMAAAQAPKSRQPGRRRRLRYERVGRLGRCARRGDLAQPHRHELPEASDMQNRYVGDIGDFGKYALLGAIAQGLKLGVVWYLTPDESDTLDGKHIRYLNLDPVVLRRYGLRGYRKGTVAKNQRRLADCDPALYGKLKGIVSRYARHVREIRRRGICPPGTEFYEETLQQGKRSEWLAEACQAMRSRDIVFLDPDNGVSIANKSPKHASLDEIRRFFDGGRRSLIIYHHSGRSIDGKGMKVDEQARHWKRELSRTLAISADPDVWALRYHRGTSRIYFIISAPKHRSTLEPNLKSFLNTFWVDRGHFSPLN